MNIKRDLYKDLQKWKSKKNRKPLLLQGARQVGKTWLIKQFGKNEFKNTAYFNFDEQTELNQFFEISKNPAQILEKLSIVNGKTINPKNTLIIFDEIQESNEALNSLKYFNEDAKEYSIIASGSLLGVSLSANKSFPVGQVDFFILYPLSFKEFLAQADNDMFKYLSSINKIEAIPNLFFNRIIEKLHLYYITGGLPEAVTSYLQNTDIEELRYIQKNILNAYKLDFSKHINSHDIQKVNYIWSSLPSQLSKENKKFLYKVVKKGARAREYENALLWLDNAGLIHIVNKITKPAFPLSAYADLSAFKVYLLDVGLLREMSKLSPSIINQSNLLFTEFKGAFAENYILQSLITQFNNKPYYWTSNNKAEIDFVIQYNDIIIPIEVKAETNIKSKSLISYAEKYQPKLKIRYSLKNLSLDNGLLNIPLFMSDFTKQILEFPELYSSQT